MDLSTGTDFQQWVWRQLLKIPLVKHDLTENWRVFGPKPGASRAVGSACGSNPTPVIVPCHRVLAATGALAASRAASTGSSVCCV
ncbi:MAG: hypothetical protein Ct9H300mP32_6800 [Verrucomicrobiota bacterium]|nr:MAG: hypothetical protein Ct9H300mP32_6800 [Verrucomicrobiota bacterium]